MSTVLAPGAERVDDIVLVAEDAAQFCELMRRVMLAAELTAGKLAEKGGHPRTTYYTYVTLSKSRARRLPTLRVHVAAWFTNCGLSDERAREAVALWKRIRGEMDAAKKPAAQSDKPTAPPKHPAVVAYERFVAVNPLLPLTVQTSPVPMPVIELVRNIEAVATEEPVEDDAGDRGDGADAVEVSDVPRSRVARAADRRRQARVATLTLTMLAYGTAMLGWVGLTILNLGTHTSGVVTMVFGSALMLAVAGFSLGRLSMMGGREMVLPLRFSGSVLRSSNRTPTLRRPGREPAAVEPELPTSSEVKQAIAQALEGQPRALATVMAEYERAQLEATATVTSLREASARAADLAAIKEAQGRAEPVAAGVLASRSASWKVNREYPTMSPGDFVSWVYRAAGLSLPSSLHGLSSVGEPVRVTGALQLGDIVFVRGEGGDQVGIYGGAGELVWLDAITHEVVRTALVRDRVRSVRRVGYRGRRFRMPELPLDNDAASGRLILVHGWLKAVGSRVLVDEPIVAVDVDGDVHTLASPVAGVLVQHSVTPNDVVDIGQALGVIEELDDSAPVPDSVPEHVVSATRAAASVEPQSHQSRDAGFRAFALAGREVGQRPAVLSDSSAQFVRRMFSNAGVTLPPLMNEDTLVGHPVSPEAVRSGDIVFTRGGRVGIYAGRGEMIEYLTSTRRVALCPVGAPPWFARRVSGEDRRPADTEEFSIVGVTGDEAESPSQATEVDDTESDSGMGFLVTQAARLDRMPAHGITPALALARYAYATVGIKLPGTMEELKEMGSAAAPESLRLGDLVIDEANGRAPVSIYAGKDRAITARPTGEVVIYGLTRAADVLVRRIDFGEHGDELEL